jgi:hypothetical protein
MNDLQALKSQLIKKLRENPLLLGCDIIEAFPKERFMPGRAAIAVGLCGLSLCPASLGGFSAAPSEQCPAGVSITLRLDLYAPGKDGRRVHSLYESLCCALLEEAAGFGLSNILSEPLRRDESAAAWHLPAKAVLHGMITGKKRPSPTEPFGGNITGFVLSGGIA